MSYYGEVLFARWERRVLVVEGEALAAGAFVLQGIESAGAHIWHAVTAVALFSEAVTIKAELEVGLFLATADAAAKHAFYVVVAETELVALDVETKAIVVGQFVVEDTEYALLRVDDLLVAGVHRTAAAFHAVAEAVHLDALAVVHFFRTL